ncbi:thioesterase domain-containing protein [Amycolatopsis sp. NBC_01307]|uniref:thioesterase II family protein n=1 Tax=Amycolatopsis sp. NBC_01307 TaxID=2903561 RepID=UPI002E0E02A0|nr:thioesterase domain-containing protein [Amycolatopsis sp. NBC_01307]
MVPLICLPFAGAGASFYQPWRKLPTEGVAVKPLQLPGRERLVDEAPYTDLHAAADGLLPKAMEIAADGPVAVFGHCLGAVIAFELTQRMTAAGATVLHLFTSASRGPWTGSPPWQGSAALSDDEFLKLVRDLTGYWHPAFDIPEMRELLLPAIRADFRMYEDYAPRSRQPLDVPITAVCADHDLVVSHDEAARWADATTGRFEILDVTGDHMYIADAARFVLDLITTTLEDVPDALAR